MPHLPHARCDQHANLRDRIPNRLRVGGFAEVPVRGLALALVLLLAADVLELLVQVAELLRELGDVRAVVFSIGLGAAYDNIKVQPDVRRCTP